MKSSCLKDSLNPADIETIYTLGPKGTFSNHAAYLVGGDEITDIQYTVTIPQVVDRVKQNPHAIGVIPIENSVSGIVGPAQDSLIDSDVVIIKELQVDVRYALLSQTPLDEVTHFYCHQVAFGQTMGFTSKNLPNAEVIYSDSNINSGMRFLDNPDKPVAAIIPLEPAKQRDDFKSYVVAEDIQDYQQNITRFFVIQNKPEDYRPDFTKRKSSIFISFDEDRHSLLFELLREFHVFGINLCRLESRPSKDNPWTYSFFMDFYNNHRVKACLATLENLEINYKLFGSYDTLNNGTLNPS